MAEQNPNARPDEQTPEQDALEKSLEELSLDELLASVKDDLARVDAMMDGPGDAAQPEQPDAPAPDAPEAAEEAPKPGMQPLFEPKIPEEYADLTVDQETQPESQEPEKKRPRLPSGIRVAIEVTKGPRIIMPSIRACPPMEVFFLQVDIRVRFLSYPLARGRVMVTVVPTSRWEVRFRLPPCILMISSATASPMPEPRRVDLPL